MVTALIILYLIVVFGFGLGVYLLWAFHARQEKLALRHGKLDDKVREGEHAIIENFAVIGKQIARLENEVKDAKSKEPRFQAKEAVKAARIARRQESE